MSVVLCECTESSQSYTFHNKDQYDEDENDDDDDDEDDQEEVGGGALVAPHQVSQSPP